ncbi:deoxyribodipyrimidine photo-lyase [Arthrobacter cryoconiti]
MKGTIISTSLIWFRDDLRVTDNPALLAACNAGNAVALYVLDEESPGVRPLGGAGRWWLHHALEDLRLELERLGIPLILRRGAGTGVFSDVMDAVGATSAFWNRRYGGAERAVDTSAKEWAVERGLHAESFQASLLHEPWQISTGQGTPYQVFTPFWRALSALNFRAPLDAPDAGHGFLGALPASDRLGDWSLLPDAPDWAGGLRTAWDPTVAGGREALADFLDGVVDDYAADRDRPDKPGTSRISPYLRWGQLSPFEVWHSLTDTRSDGAAVFASQLGWREFCWHQLFHHPTLATDNLRPRFDDYPWRWPSSKSEGSAVESSANTMLHAWQKGCTGIPLVDAGQRELWTTGFMHNRVRMVAASFLVKNLGIHWRVGEEWFWDTLVDADAASNPANWQWVAGSGADASPFFRIFNPLTQARKFDPESKYVSQWVPEFLLPGYPEPIVDLLQTRREALAAYDLTK